MVDLATHEKEKLTLPMMTGFPTEEELREMESFYTSLVGDERHGIPTLRRNVLKYIMHVKLSIRHGGTITKSVARLNGEGKRVHSAVSKSRRVMKQYLGTLTPQELDNHAEMFGVTIRSDNDKDDIINAIIAARYVEE